MKCVARCLSVLILMIGLAAGGSLLAAPPKGSRQKVKPANAPIQNIYEQQRQNLKMQIRQDQKRLKADKKRYGKDHPTVKADRQQLKKNEETLKKMPKPPKIAPRK